MCIHKFVYAQVSGRVTHTSRFCTFLPFCTSCVLYLYLCAEILLCQLHRFFIGYIEVPSAEKFTSISRVCMRVSEVPGEGFFHAAVKIKFVRCVMGKYIKSVQQGKKGVLSNFSIPTQGYWTYVRACHIRQHENKL